LAQRARRKLENNFQLAYFDRRTRLRFLRLFMKTLLRTLLSSRTSPGGGPRTLADVSAGERVRIQKLDDVPGADSLRERGLCEGVEILIIKSGDPLVCLVLGSRLMLNGAVAAAVSIEPA
jgi:Fe2+ transport system protein FeoA